MKRAYRKKKMEPVVRVYQLLEDLQPYEGQKVYIWTKQKPRPVRWIAFKDIETDVWSIEKPPDDRVKEVLLSARYEPPASDKPAPIGTIHVSYLKRVLATLRIQIVYIVINDIERPLERILYSTHDPLAGVPSRLDSWNRSAEPNKVAHILLTTAHTVKVASRDERDRPIEVAPGSWNLPASNPFGSQKEPHSEASNPLEGAVIIPPKPPQPKPKSRGDWRFDLFIGKIKPEDIPEDIRRELGI